MQLSWFALSTHKHEVPKKTEGNTAQKATEHCSKLHIHQGF